MSRFRYPKTVPLLSAHNMCRGFRSVGRRRCLIGWLLEVFGTTRIRNRNFCKSLAKACGTKWPESFNDNPSNSLADVAGKWNLFVASLGYTEVVEVCE